ncbi:MAG TPA: hypothetical protein VGM88_10155 [Kofleriaceae bacterium]|jgi:hypothetical protein
MQRIVIGLGIAVVAATVALVVMLRHHASPAPIPAASPTAARETVAPGRPELPPISPNRRPPPSADKEDGADAVTLPSGEREYTINGVRVRDHGSSRRPLGLGLRRAPQFQPLPPAVTEQMITTVRNAVADCAAQVPPDARGANPHVDAHVQLSITGGRASIATARYSLRGVGTEAPEAIACMQQHSIGAAVDAPGVMDQRDYPLTLTVSLP